MIKGKGGYDKEMDVFRVSTPKSKYKYSEQFNNFIIDRDEKGEICGMEILSASKVLKIPKSQLNETLQAEIKIKINKERVEIEMEFKTIVRNSEKMSSFMFNDINSLNLSPSVQSLALA